jgi:uncharacterized protein YcbK (DUF882 family)
VTRPRPAPAVAAFACGCVAAAVALTPARAAADAAPATGAAPAAGATPAAGAAPATGTTPAAAPSKKDLAAQAKAPHQGPVPHAGKKPAKLVNLHNLWTREWLAVDAGAPPPRATLDRFLRDHFTNQPTAMEPRLVELLIGAALHFRSDVVQIVSAFRHPKYNLILRKKGRQVARDSQHSRGTAIDFSIPRVTARALEAWARSRRLGGVGLYVDSGFIHVDTGPVRSWSGD